MYRMSCLICALVLTAGPVGAADTENWPRWRGPAWSGYSEATGLPTTWSEGEHIRWKIDLPSWAGSSPVIWGDRIFLTSPAQRKSEPDGSDVGRRLPMAAVSDPGGATINLMCLSKRDGKLLWKKSLGSGNKLYGKHNLASPSPVTDGTYVFAITGAGRLSAYDVNGNRLWRVDLQDKYGAFGLYWGYASSPIVYKDSVIVQVLHGATTDNPSYIAAFDKKTGKVVWHVERKTDAQYECPDAYTTPVLFKHDGRPRMIVSGADYVTVHDPDTGREIWRAAGLNPRGAKNYRICGTPVYADGLVVATSRERPVIAVRAGGKGNVTESHIAWTLDERKAKTPDVPSVAYDGKRLYFIHDNGFASCMEAATGKIVWGPERIATGPYSASPLVADGRIYATNEDATTTVLAAGPEFKKIAENRLDGGYTLSSFAVSDGALYLRTARHLYCIANGDE